MAPRGGGGIHPSGKTAPCVGIFSISLGNLIRKNNIGNHNNSQFPRQYTCLDDTTELTVMRIGNELGNSGNELGDLSFTADLFYGLLKVGLYWEYYNTEFSSK